MYIPRYEKAKNMFELGKFIYGSFGQHYKVPQPRILNLRNNENINMGHGQK